MRGEAPAGAGIRAFTFKLAAGSWQLKAGPRGFTLMELLVVTAIIVIITSITLVNNNQFGGAIQLDNLGYDLSLSIRQAQVYGISVARFGTNTYSAGYGVHFDLRDPKEYIFFADAAANGVYNAAGNELVQTDTLVPGYTISGLCSTSGGVESCMAATDQSPTLDILFKRPEPDAWIAARGTFCIVAPSTCQDSARIILKSPRNDQISVIIYNNGEISVHKCQQIWPTLCSAS